MQEAIGQRLKKAREYLGLDQETVAGAIEKKHSAISKIESGKQNVPNTLITFFNSKGISMDWLQYGIGEMLKPNPGPSLYQGQVKQGDNSYSGQGNQQNPQFTPAPKDTGRVAALEEKVAGLERSLIDKEGIIAAKEENIQTLKETIADQKGTIAYQKQEIQDLKQTIADLRNKP